MSPRRRRVYNIKMKLIEENVLLWNEVTILGKGPAAAWREHGNQYDPSSVL